MGILGISSVGLLSPPQISAVGYLDQLAALLTVPVERSELVLRFDRRSLSKLKQILVLGPQRHFQVDLGGLSLLTAIQIISEYVTIVRKYSCRSELGML